MSTVKPELIKIHSLTIFKANISTTENYMNHPSKPVGVEIQVSQNTAFNLEEKNIRVRLNVELSATNSSQEPIGLNGDYVIEFIIHVENFDEFILEKEDKKLVESKLGGTINGIVYSTARGIIYERTAATSFGGVILPVINPNHLNEKVI